MIPLGRKILVLPDKTEKVTKTGIIIPFAAEDMQRARTGTVIKAAKSTKIQPGSKVYYAPRAGRVVNLDGVDHIVLNVGENDDEVFAVTK